MFYVKNETHGWKFHKIWVRNEVEIPKFLQDFILENSQNWEFKIKDFELKS